MERLKVGQEFEVYNGKLRITKVKQPTIAISPISHEYLTKGKEYDIFNIRKYINGKCYFQFIGDSGGINTAQQKNCFHLDGLN